MPKLFYLSSILTNGFFKVRMLLIFNKCNELKGKGIIDIDMKYFIFLNNYSIKRSILKENAEIPTLNSSQNLFF
jgi:hypothetical protein